ncbi:terpene synthase metal binding domain protein [Aspergillus falconensis]
MAPSQIQDVLHPKQVDPDKSLQSEPPEGQGQADPGAVYVPVQLPSLFVLFLSGTPDLNPHYNEIKFESEKWLADKCLLDVRARTRLAKTDFSYFCAVATPKAGREELRTVCDWGNWVFPFDDMFDNGKLRDEPIRAQEVVEVLLADIGMGILVGPRVNISKQVRSGARADDPLIDVHTSVWRRMVKCGTEARTPGTQQRFANAMRDFCLGSLAQVRNTSLKMCPSVEDMLALRRQSAGVMPIYALIEYAHHLDIPDAVFECASIKEIQRIGVDLVLIQNDILSYCKEETESVPHNLVAITRYTSPGLKAQSAFDRVSAMLNDRYRDWYLALSELPSWGEAIDAQVQEYVEGVRAVVRANLGWSFRSKRYFGDNADEVRRTGTVMVRRELKWQW